MWISLLWALAILSAGTLTGFLFAVPRAGADTGDSGGDGKEDKPVGRLALTANTNLEQISDWLTKIIVGVGLVEAKSLAGKFRVLTKIMADHNCGVSCEPLAFAILITFSTTGFLLGYLFTRLYLSPVIGLADRGGGWDPAKTKDLRKSKPADTEMGGSAATPPEAVAQAFSIVNSGYVPGKDDSFEKRYDFAKSLLVTQKWALAAAAYAPLVSEKPGKLILQCDRLWALFKSGRAWDSEIAAVVAALDNARDNAKGDEIPTVYLSLTFHYLYANTQTAAERVVALVKEYEKLGLRRIGGMYINLACAFGQLFKRSGKKPSKTPDENERGAAEAITAALREEPDAEGRIQELFNANSADNDLAVFAVPPPSVIVCTAAGLSLPKPVRSPRKPRAAKKK